MNDAATLTRSSPKAYKSEVKPVWCPGCGHYGVLAALTKALAALEVPSEEVAVVSGIGCSSRVPAYLSTYGFHGIHGRALPLATGLKLARPELTVVVAGGDGDGFSIGGNHFISACRRNVDLTYIVMDNQVYGMTKGQASPTTDPDWEFGKLTPGGTGINPFQPLVIALASGANFVARASSSDPNGAARLIAEAVRHPGFSFVHVLSPCRTFRPEQQEWKKLVKPAPEEATDDLATAAGHLFGDTGFYVGILYRGARAPYEPKKQPEPVEPADLAREFEI
ncbi:MAG: thiamine pyrophosphate-dependent enzyme [Kiloniellales bacterium]|nr:thiamine pyrophosphate-dependent enzyme [Kiloniellales bacterium]